MEKVKLIQKGYKEKQTEWRKEYGIDISIDFFVKLFQLCVSIVLLVGPWYRYEKVITNGHCIIYNGTIVSVFGTICGQSLEVFDEKWVLIKNLAIVNFSMCLFSVMYYYIQHFLRAKNQEKITCSFVIYVFDKFYKFVYEIVMIFVIGFMLFKFQNIKLPVTSAGKEEDMKNMYAVKLAMLMFSVFVLHFVLKYAYLIYQQYKRFGPKTKRQNTVSDTSVDV